MSILTLDDSYTYGPAICPYYHSIVEYRQTENCGIFTADEKANHFLKKETNFTDSENHYTPIEINSWLL